MEQSSLSTKNIDPFIYHQSPSYRILHITSGVISYHPGDGAIPRQWDIQIPLSQIWLFDQSRHVDWASTFQRQGI